MGDVSEQAIDHLLSMRRRPRRYAGLNNNHGNVRENYERCERVKVAGGSTRKLTASEIALFRSHVQSVIDGEPPPRSFELEQPADAIDVLALIQKVLEKQSEEKPVE